MPRHEEMHWEEGWNDRNFDETIEYNHHYVYNSCSGIATRSRLTNETFTLFPRPFSGGAHSILNAVPPPSDRASHASTLMQLRAAVWDWSPWPLLRAIATFEKILSLRVE